MSEGVVTPSPAAAADGSWFQAVRTNVWVRFLVRRLIGLVGVLAALTIALFWLLQLIPGDPVRLAFGPDARPVDIERVRHENGFDKPLFEQFTRYVTHLFQGDLGKSFNTNEPVTQLISERMGKSAQLAGAALAVVLLISIPLGMFAAAFTREGRHRRFEVAFVGATSLLGSLPELLKATVFAFLLGVQFRLLPVAGNGGLKYLVLPVISLSLAPIMTLSRIVRIETLNVLAQDYIRTARGKRMKSRVIFLRHALPNVITAVLTVAGLIFAGLIGGAVIIETIFARLGMGTALVAAVNSKDIVVVQGVVLVLGGTLVIVNAIVDVLLALVDRRSLARYA
jgi:peptide/nickel transport system permease protein